MVLQVEDTNIFPSSSFLSVLSLVLLWLRSLSLLAPRGDTRTFAVKSQEHQGDSRRQSLW